MIPFLDKAVRGRVEAADAALCPGPKRPGAVHEQGIDAGVSQSVDRPILPEGSVPDVHPEQILGIGADPQIVSLPDQGVDVQRR